MRPRARRATEKRERKELRSSARGGRRSSLLFTTLSIGVFLQPASSSVVAVSAATTTPMVDETQRHLRCLAPQRRPRSARRKRRKVKEGHARVGRERTGRMGGDARPKSDGHETMGTRRPFLRLVRQSVAHSRPGAALARSRRGCRSAVGVVLTRPSGHVKASFWVVT